ncbi:MAG: MFS transporter [Fusicatenibacter sp.]|nr:MFS transporter [Fusicatenibacter sp.]
MKRKTKVPSNLTGRYAMIQSFLWMGYAAILGFASVYLLDHGFSNIQIGIISAVAGAVSAVLQPLLATIADRPSSPSVKYFLVCLNFLQLFCAGLLMVFENSAVMTGVFYGICITFLMLLTPLVNSLGAETMNQGITMNFGVARGIGSVAYAAAAYLLGILVKKAGAVTIPLFIVALCAGFLLSLGFFPFEKAAKPSVGQKRMFEGPVYFLRKYDRFAFTLLGCIFLYTSHVLLNNFNFQIVESKGGGSAELGFAMALCACVELPTMFFFGVMQKKKSSGFWFRLSGVFFMLKALGTLLVPGIRSFYCIQIFQMFGWALIQVASIYFVNSLMEEQDVVKGQAYMTMTYTIGSVVGSLLGGSLIDLFGITIMLIVAFVFGLLGMLLLLLIKADVSGKRGMSR